MRSGEGLFFDVSSTMESGSTPDPGTQTLPCLPHTLFSLALFRHLALSLARFARVCSRARARFRCVSVSVSPSLCLSIPCARRREKAVRALEALEAPRALGRHLVAQRRLGGLQVRLALLVREQLLLDVLHGACTCMGRACMHAVRCGCCSTAQGVCAEGAGAAWLRTPAPSRLAFIEAASERESCARCASIDSVFASE